MLFTLSFFMPNTKAPLGDVFLIKSNDFIKK